MNKHVISLKAEVVSHDLRDVTSNFPEEYAQSFCNPKLQFKLKIDSSSIQYIPTTIFPPSTTRNYSSPPLFPRYTFPCIPSD